MSGDDWHFHQTEFIVRQFTIAENFPFESPAKMVPAFLSVHMTCRALGSIASVEFVFDHALKCPKPKCGKWLWKR